MKDTTTKDTTMRQKNTPTITKGIVTNHMTTKAIIMAKKVTIMTTKDMTIRTMDTIMKAIIMQKKHTATMPTLMKAIITMTMLTKVIATMHTTTDILTTTV